MRNEQSPEELKGKAVPINMEILGGKSCQNEDTVKLVSTVAHLCISKSLSFHSWRLDPRGDGLGAFFSSFSSPDRPITTDMSPILPGNNLHFWQHCLMMAYMATVIVIQSVSACTPLFLSFSRSLSLSFQICT